MGESVRFVVLIQCNERPRFGYYSLWLVVNKARMDTVLPAWYTFQCSILQCNIACNVSPATCDTLGVYEHTL